MINEGKDPVQYRRLFHNFTTHSFCLDGEEGTAEGTMTVSRMVSRLFWDTAAACAHPAEVLLDHSVAERVSCIDNCAFVWKW